MRRISVMVATCICLAACAGSNGSDASDVCSRFDALTEDIEDDVLTDAELRDRVQELEEAASSSGNDELATSTRAMLTAITTGSDGPAGYLFAAIDVEAACAELD